LIYAFSGESYFGFSPAGLLFPPLGYGDGCDALDEAKEIFSHFNLSKYIVEFASKEQIMLMDNPKVIPKSGDYVYSTRKMIDLSGRDYHSHRNRKNAFVKRYNGYAIKYSDEYMKQCEDLLDFIKSKSVVNWKFVCEMESVRRVIRAPDKLGLTGIVAMVGDEVVGFSFGTELNKSMCNILIEKTNKKYVGSAQFIFSEFCKVWDYTKYCNAGDDWDIESLTATKESYRPLFRMPKWSLMCDI
jgi:hypothetical protein